MTARAKRAKRPARGKGEDSPAFSAAVDAIEEGPPPDEIKLQNGIVLNFKPVPPLLIRKATGNLTRPVAPMVDLGKGRKELNVNDPEFQKAENEYGQAAFDAGANVMLALGTSIKSVPADMQKPQDEGWVETLRSVGFDLDVSTDAARYLSWIQYYALTSEEDLLNTILGVTALTGVGESQVAAAVATFRSRAVRRSNNGVPPADSK